MSYTINFPTNNVSSTDIIKKVEEAQNTLLYQEDDLNTYSGLNFKFIFNDNNGSFNFNNLDLEFIRSYMNPICDIINLKRGQYNIIDNNTNEIIDPKSITLKSVLDEEDGEMTPNNNNNNDDRNEFELTIAFDITNQIKVIAQIRNEAKIPLKNYCYIDTELSVEVRNKQVIITFYKNNEELIKTTLDDIAKIVGIDTNEYKLYDEINGNYVVIQRNKNTEQIIPYIVSIARPDRKCPELKQYYKQDYLTNVKQEAAELIYNQFIDYVFMYENNKKKNITFKSFEKVYYEYYYLENCMRNNPWSAKAFINGKWEDITPTHEELYQIFVRESDNYSDSEAEAEEDESEVEEEADEEDNTYNEMRREQKEQGLNWNANDAMKESLIQANGDKKIAEDLFVKSRAEFLKRLTGGKPMSFQEAAKKLTSLNK